MTLQTQVQNALGELFLMGFMGTSLSEDTSQFLSQARIGGVILFKQNYENLHQLISLIRDIQYCHIQYPLWISVDQEGGRVQRFKTPFTIIPAGKIIGACTSPTRQFELSCVLAKELSCCGIHINFFPVADILTEPKNTVIGDRAYGTNPYQVARAVSALVRGHLAQKVIPCVKHFPGHGHTLEDSHHTLPTIRVPWNVLERREMIPFKRAFQARCPFVMTAHILNQAIDPNAPATLSSKILRSILRNTLRFRGVIVSDDLEMKALSQARHPGENILLALEAGCELFIIRSEETARNAYPFVLKNILKSPSLTRKVLQTGDKLRNYKNQWIPKDPYPSFEKAKKTVGHPKHQEAIKKLIEMVPSTHKQPPTASSPPTSSTPQNSEET